MNRRRKNETTQSTPTYHNKKPQISKTSQKNPRTPQTLLHAQSIHEQYDSAFGITRNLFHDSKNLPNSNNQTQQLLQAFNYSTLIFYCQKFEKAMYHRMQQMLEKFIKLEYKIARCQSHFNAIEIQLTSRSKQISTLIKENKWLIQANLQIEHHLKQLNQKYEITRIKDKTHGIQSILSKINQQLYNKQLQDIQIYQQRRYLFQHVLEVCEAAQLSANPKFDGERVKDCLKQIIQNLFKYSQCGDQVQNSLSQYIQSTILQNIDLKFRITELQSQLKHSKN